MGGPGALSGRYDATRLTAVHVAPRMFDHHEFRARALVDLKADQRVTVCLPAKDEAGTIGVIVEHVQRHLVERVPLVDEILVIDDGSVDDTDQVARAAGAHVEYTADLLPELGPGTGKGEALWKGLAVAKGDILVWCDSDVTNFGQRFVVGLLGPLLTDPSVGFVKGFYDRPVDGKPGTGGRSTELVARPMQSYGVDLGLLIDISERFGLGSIAQCDLGTRLHRNRTLDELSPQALAILQTAFTKAKIDAPGSAVATLLRPGLDPLLVKHIERPPLATIDLTSAGPHRTRLG
jgi:glucosyl-3-phosphoglycerate synthase